MHGSNGRVGCPPTLPSSALRERLQLVQGCAGPQRWPQLLSLTGSNGPRGPPGICLTAPPRPIRKGNGPNTSLTTVRPCHSFVIFPIRPPNHAPNYARIRRGDQKGSRPEERCDAVVTKLVRSENTLSQQNIQVIQHHLICLSSTRRRRHSRPQTDWDLVSLGLCMKSNKLDACAERIQTELCACDGIFAQVS